MTEGSYLPPEEMTDPELHSAYQSAKQNGTTVRIDELQLEIAQRWEEEVESSDEAAYTADGRFTSEGFSLSVYTWPDMNVEEEVWFTWDEVDDRKGDEQSDFTFRLE